MAPQLGVSLRLPPELSKAIVQCITDNRDVLALRQVCRCFFQPATEAGFKTLKIRPNHEKSARGIWMLRNHSDVVKYVEELIFLETVEPHDSLESDTLEDVEDVDEECPAPLDDILSSLHLFPGLKSVKLCFERKWDEEDALADVPEEDDYSDHLKLQVRIFDALAKNAKHNIKELEMKGVTAFPLDVLVSEDFGSFLEAFKTIRFGFVSEDFEQVYCSPVFFQFWGCEPPNTFPTMMSYASNLVELSISTEGEYAPGSYGLDTLFFPQLEQLKLGYFLFWEDPDKGPEGFITRHRKTLKDLLIEDCYMGRDNEHPANPDRLWAEVWSNIGSTMTAMEHIEVLSVGYVYMDVGFGYIQIEEGVQGDDRDEPELEKLQEKISRRALKSNLH